MSIGDVQSIVGNVGSATISTSDVKNINTGISDGRGYINNKADTIVAPKSTKGISGFLFDVPDTENISLSSDITDHFTESNSFLNDHIVHKPITITLSGFIGELVYRTAGGIEGAVQEITNKLGVVEAYAGDLTPGWVQKTKEVLGQTQQAISFINTQLDRVQNVVGFFDVESIEQTKQAKAYQELKALWQTKGLVTVQTPWEYFDSMIIKSISFTQNADSKQITDISVTLKEMRFAEVKTVNFDKDQFPPAVEVQEAAAEDVGQVRGEEVNWAEVESGLYTGYTGVRGSTR